MTSKYYIKVDGNVQETTKEEYELLKKKFEEKNKDYLCSTCRVSDCNKIIYKNINNCPEVKNAAYKLNEEETQLIDGTIKKKYSVFEFLVFECNKYEIFKELRKNKSEQISKDYEYRKILKYQKSRENNSSVKGQGK